MLGLGMPRQFAVLTIPKQVTVGELKKLLSEFKDSAIISFDSPPTESISKDRVRIPIEVNR